MAEIVVVMHAGGVAAPTRPLEYGAQFEVAGLALRPVFTVDADRGTDPGRPALPTLEQRTDLSRYYRAEVPEEAAAEKLAAIREAVGVATAYIKPAVSPPLWREPDHGGPEMVLDPAQIPDFVGRQGYLGAAPEGVGAEIAWAQAGGDGGGVSIIDIEGGWCLTHVDLAGNGGLRGGVAIPDRGWRDHGTAVLGVMGARRNGFGVTGIAPGASVSAFSHDTVGSAGAIQRSADLLDHGDVLVLEMHRPGPLDGFRSRMDQLGYIAVEWWPDDFAAIRYAVSRGVTVVEAAGNGAQNLDAPLYDTPDAGFPDDWVNPFSGPDSGAVLVGAGAPAGGAYGLPRSRLGFSNFGSRVDCQGWGEGVCAPGYGDLYRGRGEHHWYTGQFNGTSSASPVVAGVAACLQGIARQRGEPLKPHELRELLRRHGSPQTGDLGERIGSLPDLGDLIGNL